MVTFDKRFLHITATGSLILTLITGGIPGLIWAFIFGLSIGQLYQQAKREKNG